MADVIFKNFAIWNTLRKVSGKKLLRGPTNSNYDVITSYDVIVANFPIKFWGAAAPPAPLPDTSLDVIVTN